MTELRLPELAPGMDTATLATWLRKEGDHVAAGEPVAEIETDKTSVELEAPHAGIIVKLHVHAGATVSVGALLAEFDGAATAEVAAHAAARTDTGGDVREHPAAAVAMPSTDVTLSVETPLAHAVASDARAAAGAPAPLGEPAAGMVNTGGAGAMPPLASAGTPARVTPLAARMAQLARIDLTRVVPSAPDGRIRKADIDAWLARQGGTSTAPAANAGLPGSRAPRPLAPPPPAVSRAELSAFTSAFEDRPLSAMRRVTASRLQLAKQTIPHFYLETAVSADALMAARELANSRRPEGKLTVTDFLVCACAQALRDVPAANAAWADDAIRIFESVDIAVAVNTPKGLVTPVIRRCHEKSLGALSRELKALATKAREGVLAPNEYAGGTFTISNLGMYGITSITPIVNPPQCAILGVGAVEARPVVVNGALAVGHIMHCTLAADHRVIDGATGAELLAAIKRWLEEPVGMALRV